MKCVVILRITMCLFYEAFFAEGIRHEPESLRFSNQRICIMVHIFLYFCSTRSNFFCIDCSYRCMKASRVEVLLVLACSDHVGGCHIHCIHICWGNRLLQPESISNTFYCIRISSNCIFWSWGKRAPPPRLFLPFM